MNFREFETSSGAKIILGKNAEQNDELMKKFKGKKNTILHTVAPGSPFCVIKEPLISSAEDIATSGAFCAKYSQDWRDHKKNVKISIFTGKDVYKDKDMETGTWGVKKAKTKTIKKEIIEKVDIKTQ